MKDKPKIIVILGPTASGKSDLAVVLAKKFDGEVVSADSRQVYKGLDIGTGKITQKEMKGVPHHLLDIVSAKKAFTVADFQRLANKKISEIISRGKLPIICGGTGFYIDAVVKNNIFPDVPPNPKLRAQLEKLDAEKIFIKLQKIDSDRAKSIDKNNKVRLIRAIEIAKVLGNVPKVISKPLYDTLEIGISIDESKLTERINIRLLKRIRAGMIKEAVKLHKAGLSWKRMEELGLEYKYLAKYLKKEISKKEMVDRLSIEIRQYSKRQIVWFKRNNNIHWQNPQKTKPIEKLISDFLKKR